MAFILWKFFKKRYMKVRRSVYDASTQINVQQEQPRKTEDYFKEISRTSSEEQQIDLFDSPSSTEISKKTNSSKGEKKKFNIPKYCSQLNKRKENSDRNILEIHSRPPEGQLANKSLLEKEENNKSPVLLNSELNKPEQSKDSPSKGKKHRRRRNKKKNDKDNTSVTNNSSYTATVKQSNINSSVGIDTKESVNEADAYISSESEVKCKEKVHLVIDHGQPNKTTKLDLSIKNSLPGNDSSIKLQSGKLSPKEYCLKNQVEVGKKLNKTQQESRTSSVSAPALSTAKCIEIPNDHVLNLYLVKSAVEENKLRRSISFTSLNKNRRNDVSHLVAYALNEVFNSNANCYAELVRQARDVLVCCYQGNIPRFRDEFLHPAALLLKKLKWNERISAQNSCFLVEDGWPLVYNNHITIHLGEADSRLKVGDFYLCICKRSTGIELVLKYRSPTIGIQENVIPKLQFGSLFTMDWLHSLHLESTSDEQLTTLLQYMLVAVEKGIDRIKWEIIARPCLCNQSSHHLDCSLENISSATDIKQQHLNCAEVNSLSSVSDNPEIMESVSDIIVSNYSNVDSSDQVTLIKENLTDINKEHALLSNSSNHNKDAILSCEKNTKSMAEKLKTTKNITVKNSSAQTSPTEEYKEIPDNSVSQQDNETQPETSFSSKQSPATPSECSPTVPENTILHNTSGKEIIPNQTDEKDDGYHNSCLVHPKKLTDILPELIQSRIAILSGTRDCSGRSIIVINPSHTSTIHSLTAAQVAQLLLYYHTILRKELAAEGVTILIDCRSISLDDLGFFDEIFSLVDGNISGAINNILVWRGTNQNAPELNIAKLFMKSKIKYEIIYSSSVLAQYVTSDQLLTELDGLYNFDLNKWLTFRKKYEPFVEECRSCGRKLITAMQGLKGSRLPSTSKLTSQVIDDHKQKMQKIIENPQLVRLQKEGINILAELEAFQMQQPENPDYKDAMERARALFNELHRATLKLSRLSEKRLYKLEQALQLRSFEEDTSQILSWLCKTGEPTLTKYKQIAENLIGIRTQEREFERFYYTAMSNIEKGNDLLEEANTLNQTHSHDMSAMKDLTLSLKNHLQGFSEHLEDTRERLEDTSKFYQMLDKAYEWALEAMKFVSRMKMEQNMTAAHLDQCMKTLQNYLTSHPPLSDEMFSELISLANKLKNERFLEQCKVAQARCQETSDLIHTRQATFLKARIQLESNNQPLNEYSPNSEIDISVNPDSPSWTSPPPNLLFPFTRRRSIAVMPSSGYSSSGGYVSQGYSSFFRETYQLDSYISEHEETYSEDAPPNYTSTPVSSTNNCVKQIPSVINKQSLAQATDLPPAGHSTISTDEPASNTPSENTEPIIPIHHHSKPHKKYMRRSQTWQYETEPWQKGISMDPMYRLLGKDSVKDFEKGSLESIQTVETEDRSNVELPHSPSVSYANSKICPPVSVNSHLHNSGSALSLQFPSCVDTAVELTEEQIKHRRTLMLILSEMTQTERDYVKSLEYIIENYIPELLRDDIPQALRGKRNVVFGNIEKIYEFHNQYFLQELERCERTPFHVGHCFLKYERQFYLYALYNKNKPKSDDLMLEYGSSFFKAKQQELGDKMDLASYLLKPVQRMGKYALLLKQLLKECPEKHPEYADLKAAEDMVKFQLRHGNDLLAMDCIRESDVDLKEQGRLLCQDEFLVFQGRSRKCLRHVFLFEEIIVFSKARRNPVKNGQNIYQYKNSVKMADIGLTERVGESSMKFEIWFRKCKVNDTYTFQAPNSEIKQSWVQEISKLLWKQALRNRELRLAEMSSMGIGNKPCLDIKPSNDQIHDRSINITQLTKGPKHRNSIAVISTDQFRNNKRPHSIISVSSSSSGSSQSSYSLYGALNLGFDPNDSPNHHHRRSVTQQSQCSAESGIVPDIGLSYENFADVEAKKKLERSGSNASAESSDTGLFTISSAEERTDESMKRLSSEA